jgi:SpoVK/Ycf46/Vps4 family AAA+-type ATPase
VQKDSKYSNVQEKIYGLSQEYTNLKDTVLNSLFKREELIENQLGPLKGLLISGYSGTGKSTLVRVLFE